MADTNPSATFIRRLLMVSILATLVLPSLAAAQTVASLPSSFDPVNQQGGAKPIGAWTKFCEQSPSECEIDPLEPERVELTAKVWQSIVKVNGEVNSAIKAVTDEDHVGVVDRWEFPDDGKGDCEDIQLLKRRKLAGIGFPHRAMRMTVVIDELGAGHAVLMIRTDRGDFILDNKHDSVLPWQKTGYVYVKREGSDGKDWVSLGGVIGKTTTATAGQ